MKAADNRLSSITRWFAQELNSLFDEREARNISLIVVEEILGFNRPEQIIQSEERLSESDILKLYRVKERLLKPEPLQYILGKTWFYGLELSVGPEVLIPRPETEELVDQILSHHPEGNKRVLDIGTGSGCIALSLKSRRETWTVTAWDVSEEALERARKNAQLNKLEVAFEQVNILNQFPTVDSWDIIVSNPPYIPHGEAPSMPELVLKNEPALALFCPDDDPLLFYRKIADFAGLQLRDSGELWFEVHENLAPRVLELMAERCWEPVVVMQDLQGKDRMIRARKLRASI